MCSVKYFYYSYKRANERGFVNSYLFYLQLKSICNNGTFKRGEFIKEIAGKLNYCPASVSNHIKRLIKLGFIEEYQTKHGNTFRYNLVSYKRGNKILGFKDRYKVSPHFKYKVISISSFKDKKALKAFILSLEFEKNFQKQHYKLIQQLKRKQDYHQITLQAVKSKKVKEKKIATLKSISDLLKESQTHDSPTTGQFKTKHNQNVRISCKKSSNLLGYKSSMTGLKLQKIAQENNLLSVKKEVLVVENGISKQEFQDNFTKYDKCFWSYGRVYKRLCNKISLEPVFFNSNNIHKTSVSSIV